jgi:DNA-directed RNA polymerase subunit RPC12/RpoP
MLSLRCVGCGNPIFTEEMPMDQVIILDDEANRYLCGYCGHELGLKK